MTTKQLLTRTLLAGGLVLIAGGLILGFLPKTANGVNCGSAFHGSNAAAVTDLGSTLAGSFITTPESGSYGADCADARSGAKAPAVILLVLGSAALVAGCVTAASKDPEQEQVAS